MRAADNEDYGVAYVYCDYAEDQTAEDIIASLAKQLALRKISIPGPVKTLHEQCSRGKIRPDLSSLTETLKSLCVDFGRVFLVLDALDECKEKGRKLLLAQLEKIGHPVRVFLTSRPHLNDLQGNF